MVFRACVYAVALLCFPFIHTAASIAAIDEGADF